MPKKDILADASDMTTAVVKNEKKYTGPMVQIYLQELENPGEEGMQVDQYEHVTIANQNGRQDYMVHRGEWVSVPVPVFIALKEKYPML